MRYYLFTYSFLALISCLFLSSCRNTQGFDKNVKELDSLKIVLVQSIDNFRSVDSLRCILAYQKNNSYGRFLDKNLKDTVTIKTAESLQLFYSTHNSIKSYVEMRGEWLRNASISIKQLTTLSHDLKNGSVNTEEAIGYINTEKKLAEKNIEELKQNTEIIRAVLDTHTKYLPEVEELVKTLNKGVLPTLQKVDLSNKH